MNPRLILYRPCLQLDTTLEIFTLREKYFENPLMYNAAIMTRKDALTQAAPGFLPNQRKLPRPFATERPL